MDTRERILSTATEVFAEKGLAGARMQEIADRAGVNKAMLHYYFTSKEQLYESVIVSTLTGVMTGATLILRDEGRPVDERLRSFVASYFDALREHAHMPRLIMQDLMAGGERIVEYFRKAAEQAGLLGGLPALEILEEGIRVGRFRRIDPKQAIVSLVSLVVFYFLARPILSMVLEIAVDDQDRFLRDRKEHVIDVFLHGIVASPTPANCDVQGGHGNG